MKRSTGLQRRDVDTFQRRRTRRFVGTKNLCHERFASSAIGLEVVRRPAFRHFSFLVQKRFPFLRRERLDAKQRSGHRVDAGCIWRLRAENFCKSGDGGVIEKGSERDFDFKRGFDPGNDLQCRQGMTAALEKGVVDPKVFDIEDIRPDATEDRLNVVLRRRMCGPRPPDVLIREGGSVNFAVRRVRKGSKHDDLVRNGIWREYVGNLSLDLLPLRPLV